MISNSCLYRNETEVESKLIVQYLLPNLGYTSNTWYQEVAFGKIRLDFMAFTARMGHLDRDFRWPLGLIIEAKSPKKNLDHHFAQIRKYMFELRSPYGVLTNGKDFRIYELRNKIVELCFRCTGTEIKPKIEQIKSLVGRDQLASPPLVIPEIHISTTPQEKKSMKIISVYHNKGGVGKTTTVVNLAAAFQQKGKKVLIVDFDSQANTTYATGLAKFLDESEDNIKNNNIRQLVESKDKFQIKDVARPASFVAGSSIDVIPAHISMMEVENKFTTIEASKFRLLSKLKAVEKDYDIVLIDTPPSLNLYARIALITAGYLIIPSDLKPFANEGLNNVRDIINDANEVKDMYGLEPLKVLGVLPSKVSTNSRFVKYTYPKRRVLVEERYGFPVLSSSIFEREDLAKALEHTIEYGEDEIPDPLSVFDYKPDSISASEFEKLADEILEKMDA
ncbi:MAG: AAA family ATPase [Limnothrix sp. RL_2_0]|nr:AAA family ATPase [Limnothrix sp. RL_2_0]